MTNGNLKRRYGKSLKFVQAVLVASSQIASDLVAAPKTLIDSGLHAPALSPSVLALEELSKLCAIDELLFARAGAAK